MIVGTVKAGCGMASTSIVVGDRLAVRSAALGLDLVPGTLNVRVTDVAGVVTMLGEPDVIIPEPWSTTSDLRAWRVRLTVGDLPPADGYVTRGVRSSAPNIETMAAVHWRSLGARDGDVVRIERVP